MIGLFKKVVLADGIQPFVASAFDADLSRLLTGFEAWGGVLAYTLPQCTGLLIDADRYAIYDPKLASPPKDAPWLKRYLMDRARDGGFKVVDMAPLFHAEYARTRLKFDYWPVDRHWSRVGHELAAEAVMTALFSGTDGSACMPGNAAAGN